uniref:Uncharacterized protein n=1 Tax=Glossina palpalis gambiensis TaxID=67801 RepID=A0A1B0B598_9MUSC
MVHGGSGVSDDSDSHHFFSIVRRKKKPLEPLPSDQESGARDIPITNGTSVWSKQDKIPILENFIGNSGVKQIPANHSSVNEVFIFLPKHQLVILTITQLSLVCLFILFILNIKVFVKLIYFVCYWLTKANFSYGPPNFGELVRFCLEAFKYATNLVQTYYRTCSLSTIHQDDCQRICDYISNSSKTSINKNSTSLPYVLNSLHVYILKYVGIDKQNPLKMLNERLLHDTIRRRIALNSFNANENQAIQAFVRSSYFFNVYVINNYSLNKTTKNIIPFNAHHSKRSSNKNNKTIVQ